MEGFDLRKAQAGTGNGALTRLLEQESLDRELQEFIRTTPEMNPILQMAMRFIQADTGLTSLQTTNTPSYLQQIAGMIGAITKGASQPGKETGGSTTGGPTAPSSGGAAGGSGGESAGAGVAAAAAAAAGGG